jgi:hypothetical protein
MQVLSTDVAIVGGGGPEVAGLADDRAEGDSLERARLLGHDVDGARLKDFEPDAVQGAAIQVCRGIWRGASAKYQVAICSRVGNQTFE